MYGFFTRNTSSYPTGVYGFQLFDILFLGKHITPPPAGSPPASITGWHEPDYGIISPAEAITFSRKQQDTGPREGRNGREAQTDVKKPEQRFVAE